MTVRQGWARVATRHQWQCPSGLETKGNPLNCMSTQAALSCSRSAALPEEVLSRIAATGGCRHGACQARLLRPLALLTQLWMTQCCWMQVLVSDTVLEVLDHSHNQPGKLPFELVGTCTSIGSAPTCCRYQQQYQQESIGITLQCKAVCLATYMHSRHNKSFYLCTCGLPLCGRTPSCSC